MAVEKMMMVTLLHPCSLAVQVEPPTPLLVMVVAVMMAVVAPATTSSTTQVALHEPH